MPKAAPRRAAAQDAPACARIVCDWLAGLTWMANKPGYDALLHGLQNGIATFDVWVIGDPVAGYLSLDPATDLIRGFYTAAPGHGTGAALLSHVKTGRDRLQLWTHADNSRAHRFYAREGFARSGDTRIGADGLTEWHMQWTRA